MIAALAAATAFLLIAFQVAGKATRDALFLSQYPVSALPAITVVSAVASIALALAGSRKLLRRGPAEFVPAGLTLSAGLLVAEWLLAVRWPHVAAVVVHLHYAAFGALLVSAFWSFLNERFDPRTAKRTFGRVTAGGALGGLAGGFLAERVGATLPLTAMLPALAALHAAAAWGVRRLARTLPALGEESPEGTDDAVPTATGIRALGASSYLRSLAALVALVTVTEGLVDWAWKARAAEAMIDGAGLLRYFALFYTGTSLLTVLVQVFLTSRILERLGPARVAGFLPLATATGGAGALFAPGLAATTILRGGEAVVSNSLYRAGFETLFAPVPAREKRAAKPVIDVGAARLGDLAGAAIVQGFVVLGGMGFAPVGVLALSVLSSAGAAWLALALHGGYLRELERGLVGRAVRLDLSVVRDAVTRSVVLQQLGSLRSSALLEGVSAAKRERPVREATPAPAEPVDPLAARAAAIASGRRDEVRDALADGPLPVELVPRAIALLAWDEVAAEAIAALRATGAPALPALVEALGDAEGTFAIRRRVPLVLGTIAEPASVAALLRALEDRRFEVRYRAGRALARLCVPGSPLVPPAAVVFAGVRREVGSERRVWETQRILDRWDDDTWSPLADDALRSRADRSLEHVFTLLSLVLPRQPLRIAYRGLSTGDPLLRGTALEYLETILPTEVREPLWPFLDDDRPRRGARRTPEDALADLLRSGESIRIRIDELRAIDAVRPPEDDAR